MTINIDKILGRLNLDEKIGQCLTQSWRGSIVTPSAVQHIEKLHTSGLRIEPYTTEAAQAKSYGRKVVDENYQKPDGYFAVDETYWRIKYPGFNITAEEYSRRLNRLRAIAMERNSGLPLHICTDFEGDFSHDFPFDGINLFPANMGIRAAGGPELAFEVGKALAAQLSAIGINMLHSPVLDINVNPENPEINIRSFSDDPAVFSEYAVQYMKGLEAGGIIATAKHFPGRGDSTEDSHHGLPVLDVDRKRLDEIELAPYRACIDNGLRAVMVAHNAYPALEPEEIPATISEKIVTGVLREELGFRGVVTTDAMGMGAIVQQWGVPAASAMALKAGCDLILLKFDNELRSQTFFEIRQWVKDGKLSEDCIDTHVKRILTMKAEQGLFEDGGRVDSVKAGEPIRDKNIISISTEVSRRAVMVLRDKKNLLPLDDRNVMLIEQMIIPEFVPNNMYHHAHSFSEAFLGYSLNAIPVDTEFKALPEEEELILSLLDEVDCVVMTNYYWRICPENNMELIRRIKERGKDVITVTNNPYPHGVSPDADAVICTFSVTPNSLKAAADVIFGKLEAKGTWPLENYEKPE